jgi:transposase
LLHEEFIRFLNAIERAVPVGKLIHAIADNYATHKHPKVQAWLARHPRWTFHFTPTSCSWLNAVENFFATLTKRRLKRGGVLLYRRPPGRHQPLSRRAQPQTQALRLEGRPKTRPGCYRTREASVRVDPLALLWQIFSFRRVFGIPKGGFT